MPILPIPDPKKYCTVVLAINTIIIPYSPGPYYFNDPSENYEIKSEGIYTPESGITGNYTYIDKQNPSKSFVRPLVNRYFDYSSVGARPSKSYIYFGGYLFLELKGSEAEIYSFIENKNYEFPRWPPFSPESSILYTVIYSTCSIPQGFPKSSATVPNFIYSGTAAPPPPPPKNMNCCDCNTIATIIESQMMARDKLFENLKDHIDQRIKEEITIHGKQLEALEVDLQPVIDRINEAESNLWNGKR